VVTAAAGGPLDLVRHGENGWLWAGEDPLVLAAQVAAVRDDRAGLAQVAAGTRAWVVGRTWARITDQLLGHYAQAIAIRARREGVDGTCQRIGHSA
jgi:phosphatidylinositol alpha 1,6-mannosyltransferase